METRALILYGSETGCSQEFAETIGREFSRRSLPSIVCPMDEYPVTNLPSEKLVIFVLSTTGQGEMPKNMRNFWRFLLRRSLPSDSLANTRVAVGGLGDSGYQSFNFSAKKLFKRLLQLSAKFIIEPVYADDQHPLGWAKFRRQMYNS